jgi:serine/threonine protein phosphatase 1
VKRHLAIGDIHGCFKALSSLAEFVGFGPSDTVITLGDYVNRGPNSCAVLDWLIRFQRTNVLIPIRGNHDIMMVEARNGSESFRRWIECGGDATLRSYAPFEDDPGRLTDVSDDHWRFLESQLVASFEIEGVFFVHANAYSDLPLEDQPDYMLYWEHISDAPLHESGKVMVCGHTSQKSGFPLKMDHAICIDTWACGGGWLTCLHVESGKIWQANEQGERRQLHLEDLSIER